MSWFVNPFSEEIWKTKYAGTYEDVKKYFKDLAKIVSLNDRSLEKSFFNLIWGKKFLPAGRILAFSGRQSAYVSLMNCTTHQVEGDSLESISNAAYTLMRASSRGQGIGLDLSKLRPKDSPVNNAAKTSTGSISFMEMLAAVGQTIGQEGRRAAILFSLRADHPDLWRPDEKDTTCPRCNGNGCTSCDGFGKISYDFLNVKKFPNKVENANISVSIPDSFMERVLSGDMWGAKFNGVSGGEEFTYEGSNLSATDVFMEIAKSAWATAEPGVLFWDTSKKKSNSDLFGFPITGVNACSEQVLDQEGVCNLGSMNLFEYVVNPFTDDSHFDYRNFARDVRTAITFLDNVLEVELTHGSPVSPTQENAIRELRRVGLGVMGLGDVFAALGIAYGSDESREVVESIFTSLRDNAYLQSIKMAKESGPAPVWLNKSWVERVDIVNQGFFKTLSESIKRDIVEFGTRNITLLSVAPTGSISNLLGVTSGIEPLFAESYTRRLKMYGGEDQFVEYIHPGVIQAREAGRPDAYTTAYTVTPDQHLEIQAKAQEYVDQSISKTVNLPAEATPEDVYNLYHKAWIAGIKGLTVYRDGSRDEQILYETDPKTTETCPNCGNGLIHHDGCKECTSCGWGACSM